MKIAKGVERVPDADIPAQLSLTLRDYFAAAALIGLVADRRATLSTVENAYAYADAMLVERDERGKR